MFIKQLKMKNFKSVSEADLVFNKGITLFSGDNGEGKSTALHAITLLLFNTYEMKSLKEYIKWGEDSFLISMDFDHEGESYTISLSFNSKGLSKRELFCNGTLWEGSNAISKMAEIIDPDLAKASMISMQDEKNLITTTPSQRREYLKKVYNLEFKDELIKIAEDIERVSQESERIKGQLVALQNISYDHKELKELPSEDEVRHYQRILESYDSRVKEVKEKQNAYDELIYTRRNLCEVTSDLERKIKEIKSSIEIIQDKISEKTEKIKSFERTDVEERCKEEIKELEERYIREKQKFEKILDDSRQCLNETTSDLASYSSGITRDKVHDLEIVYTELNSQYRAEQQTIFTLSDGVCPVCGKPVTEEELNKHKSQFEEIKAKMYKAKEDYELANVKLTDIEKDIRILKERKESYEREIASFSSRIERLDKDHEHEKQRIEEKAEYEERQRLSSISSLKESIDTLNISMENQENALHSHEEMLSSKEKELESVRTKLLSFEDVSEALNALHREFDEPLRWMEQYKRDVTSNEAIEKYNAEMDRKEEERQIQMSVLEEKQRKTDGDIAKMTLAKNIIQKEFPSYVISHMIKTLKDYINEFLEKVYPKYEVSIEESRNSLNVTYGDYKADVKGASGFEKSVFSLAYMYALGKMQSYGCIIVDEGDGAASVEKSLKFYETLGHSTQTFSQIITITHKEEAKELLKNDFGAKVYTVSNGTYEEG